MSNIEVSKYQPITLAASLPLLPLDLNLFTAGHKAIKIKTGTTLMNPFNTLCVIEETTAKLSANPAPIIIPKIRAIKDSKYPGMLLIKSFMLWIKI